MAAEQAALVQALRDDGDARIGWPDEKPAVAKNDEGWFLPANQRVLRLLCRDSALVLELGAYLGKSTRFIEAAMPAGAHLITCDAWDNDFLEVDLGHNYQREGPGEQEKRRRYPLYETFLANCWHARARINCKPS